MKRLILLAGLVAVAGCNQSEPAPEPTETATTAPAPVMLTANGSAPGAYTATTPEGTVTTSTLKADGTYTDTDADGKVTAEGTWAVTDGKTCFTPTTEGVEAMCYTESPAGADGTFTATPDKGDPVTVKPAAAPAAE
ncbi:hypothetical protein GRI89_08415 [Altererythrobacter salegens]|uniref:Lipoprotein n=1 Tax=Croceibacterium salegens TaxID=1737568 RepID=A0A6I4SUL8_9SPHN|nr:hypothetical protein [Croceibacterium salegens]MXO59563.1 hypothetical protein [Croceibacterium salegens]